MLKILGIAVLLSIFGSSTGWSVLTRDIGIADFTNITNSPELDNYTKAIPTLIFTHLANSQKLSLVSHQEIEKMLDEMDWADVGIVDPKTAAKMGYAVGARYIFIGQLTGFQSKSGMRIRITTQLVDVQSTQVIGGWQRSSSSTELDNQSLKLARDILRLFRPVSPYSAAGRSLLLPGWGQFANNRTSGYFFSTTALLALGGLAYTQYSFNQANDEYKEIIDREYKTYIEFQNASDKRDNRKNMRQIVFIATIGLWVANIVDSAFEAHLLSKQIRNAESKMQVQSLVEPNSAKVLLTIRF